MVYWWLVRHAPQDRREQIDQELAMPLPGEAADPDDPVWSADAEMAAFEALSQQVG